MAQSTTPHERPQAEVPAATATQQSPPPANHNQPSARSYLHEMRHAAHLFSASDHTAETHLLAVMQHAYRLRCYREENDAQRDEVDGLLGREKIAETARTSPFTRLLKLAFHKDECDKDRISRSAKALQRAWHEGVEADGLLAFIDRNGGIVKCGQGVKAASSATARPEPISLPCDPGGIDLKGHSSVAGTLRKTDAGWQFTPSKVLAPVRQPGLRKAGDPPKPATA